MEALETERDGDLQETSNSYPDLQEESISHPVPSLASEKASLFYQKQRYRGNNAK
jgi:hypothetical protein